MVETFTPNSSEAVQFVFTVATFTLKVQICPPKFKGKLADPECSCGIAYENSSWTSGFIFQVEKNLDEYVAKN